MDEAVYFTFLSDIFEKGMNQILLSPAISRYLSKLDSVACVRQRHPRKEHFEIRQAALQLNTDFVSHCDRCEEVN